MNSKRQHETQGRTRPLILPARVQEELRNTRPTGAVETASPLSPTYIAGLILSSGVVAWLAAPLMV